ncbi:MAG TPA: hypothetical protein VMU19_08845 [Bryobacteraceae bacterium]|nr:hypothetical protein [Bryobacteraceae bacterium]
MGSTAQSCQSLAARLADNLLKAWLTGDTAGLHDELEHSAAIPAETRDAGEQERRWLLQAVARRMMQFPNELDSLSQSPQMELCIRLLWHMAPKD